MLVEYMDCVKNIEVVEREQTALKHKLQKRGGEMDRRAEHI